MDLGKSMVFIKNNKSFVFYSLTQYRNLKINWRFSYVYCMSTVCLLYVYCMSTVCLL